jgi:hypothetical protein
MFDYKYIINFIIGGTYLVIFKYMNDHNIAPKYVTILAALPTSLFLYLFTTKNHLKFIIGSNISLSISITSLTFIYLLNYLKINDIISKILGVIVFFILTVLKVSIM